jgi:hypothetical protein
MKTERKKYKNFIQQKKRKVHIFLEHILPLE